jgi:hypothetical protein
MSGAYYSSYDDDGRIIATGRCSNPEEQVPETGGVFIGAVFDGDLYYFSGGMPTLRPEAPAVALSAATVVADGETTVILSGVPAGAKVRMGDAELTADGTDIALSTDLIGENKVMVDAFPAKPWRGIFNGTTA